MMRRGLLGWIFPGGIILRTVTLFIAVSLDGYIADRNGGVEWLQEQDTEYPDEGAEPDSYSEFISEIDTILMGFNTFHQVSTELSPDVWPYPDQTSYVITHRSLPSTERIRFTSEPPCELLRKLRKEDGKGIWICGGANLARQLMREDLIDVWHISVIPTLLGGGIRLFEELEQERKLRLIKAQSCHGITELVYERR